MGLKIRSGTVALTCGERPEAAAAGDTDTLDPPPTKPPPASALEPALAPTAASDSERGRFNDVCVPCPDMTAPWLCMPPPAPMPALPGGGDKWC